MLSVQTSIGATNRVRHNSITDKIIGTQEISMMLEGSDSMTSQEIGDSLTPVAIARKRSKTSDDLRTSDYRGNCRKDERKTPDD